MPETDPFERAKLEKLQKDLAATEEATARDDMVHGLFRTMLESRESFVANGIGFHMGVKRDYSGEPNRPCIIIWLLKDTSKNNAIDFRNAFWAHGGVLRDYDWDEETHSRSDRYLTRIIGETVEAAVAEIAKKAIVGELPAPGSSGELGFYELVGQDKILKKQASRRRLFGLF